MGETSDRAGSRVVALAYTARANGRCARRAGLGASPLLLNTAQIANIATEWAGQVLAAE